MSNQRKIRKFWHLRRKILFILLTYSLLLGGGCFLINRYAFVPIILLICLGSILFYATYRTITHITADPIEQLIRTIQHTEDLDHLVMCNIPSQDELGVLANSLDGLFVRLKDNHDALKTLYKKERNLQHNQQNTINYLSHEMKTPLSIINSHAQSIIDGMDRESPSQRAQKITSEITQLTNLITSLLDQATLDTHELNRSTFDLAEIVDNLVDRLCSKDLYPNHTYNIEIPAEEVCIVANQTLIERAITNLITNANKYTLDGHVSISLAQNYNSYYLSIKNTSKPYSATELINLWENFYRKTEGLETGHGVGLPTVKRILDKHHFVHHALYRNGVFEIVIQFSPKT